MTCSPAPLLSRRDAQVALYWRRLLVAMKSEMRSLKRAQLEAQRRREVAQVFSDGRMLMGHTIAAR